MRSKAYWLIIILLVVVAVFVTATIWYVVSKAGKDYTVRVGYKRTSAYQIYLVAQSQRLFEKHGVNVEGVTFNSTDQMLQALALNRLDATAGGSLEVAASLAAANPVFYASVSRTSCAKAMPSTQSSFRQIPAFTIWLV